MAIPDVCGTAIVMLGAPDGATVVDRVRLLKGTIGGVIRGGDVDNPGGCAYSGFL